MFFDSEFSMFSSIFMIFFLLIAGLIIMELFRGIKEWHQNSESPRLSVEAKIVDKHTHTDVHHHNGDHHAMHTTASTTYYVTFEVESGDRMVFKVKHHQYGLLVEGDQGKLQFQGTRFLSFERIHSI